MTTLDDIRQICARFPETSEGEGTQFSMGVTVKGKRKGICWTWLDRPNPKKGRVPNPSVLAIRTPGLEAKEALLASDEVRFFTEDHYNGYPAILVRLELCEPEDLEDLLLEAWRTQAPKALQALLKQP